MLKEIKFHPYKLQDVQQLNNRDKEVGVAFCTAMSGLLRENPDILNNFLMTDKAHSHLSCFVNKQNIRY